MTADISDSGALDQISPVAEGQDRRPLQVLHLFRALHPGSGGPLAHLESVLRILDPSEIRTRVATIQFCQPPPTIPPPEHVGVRKNSDVANAIRCARWLWPRMQQVDLVQIHGVFGWQLVIGAILCSLSGMPFLVRPHGSLSEMFLNLRPFRKRLFLRFLGLPLLRRARGLIAMTPSEEAFIKNLDNRLSVRLISPGVELPERVVCGGEVEAYPVVFVGRVAPVKGLPQLFAALAIMRSRGIPATLSIVGDGADGYIAALRAQLHRLGIAQHVHFLGRLEGAAKWEAMRAARVLALPSRGENFSHVTAEALALGMPVVVSDQVALAPLVQQADCGRVVPLDDNDAMATALAELADQNVWGAAAVRARACAEQHLSLEKMRESVRSLYLEAVPWR